jgi:hypothetical protein
VTAWQISESGASVQLKDGSGAVTFTVTNPTDVEDRVVLSVTPLDGAADDWFTVERPQPHGGRRCVGRDPRRRHGAAGHGRGHIRLPGRRLSPQTFTITVDPDDTIAESDESNNQTTATGGISVGNGPTSSRVSSHPGRQR